MILHLIKFVVMLNKILLLLFAIILVSCSKEDPVPSCVDSTLEAVGESSQSSGCEALEGIVNISASGGAGGYMYAIDGGANQSTPQFSSLPQGLHDVKIMDENGCFVEIEVQVFSGMTYTKDAVPIFVKSCAVTGCHVPGTGLPDWLDYDVAKAGRAGIKFQTQNGDMPRGGSLTQNEKDILACWVDDGAPF